MKQVQEGLFEVEEQMPCSPRDIGIYRYALPNTLNRAEREEAAARILSFSQQLDRWVGVSWTRLAEMMKEEYKESQRLDAIRRHNFDEQGRTARATRRYYTLCVLTLGTYALFVSKPTAQMKEEPKEELPFSGIFLFGPNHVVTGIHELVEKQMLRRVTEGEGENALDVFFPTPTLVNRIMEVQGVSAS